MKTISVPSPQSYEYVFWIFQTMGLLLDEQNLNLKIVGN